MRPIKWTLRLLEALLLRMRFWKRMVVLTFLILLVLTACATAVSSLTGCGGDPDDPEPASTGNDEGDAAEQAATEALAPERPAKSRQEKVHEWLGVLSTGESLYLKHFQDFVATPDCSDLPAIEALIEGMHQHVEMLREVGYDVDSRGLPGIVDQYDLDTDQIRQFCGG
jgi:hypothetical protein